jgi:NSS family neurotransmitter:Na+ symporter
MHMPGGQWLGALFLVGLVTVAFLSNIAALAVAAAALSKNETQDQSASLRPRVFIIIAVIELALMALISYDNDWIGTFDLIFGSGMQVGGSLLAIVAVAWGFSRSHLAQQVFGHSAKHGLRDRLWQLWLRWVIPGILMALLLGYVLSQLA